MRRTSFGILFLFLSHYLMAQQSLHILFTGGINGVIKSDHPELHGDILRIQAAVNSMKSREGIADDQMLLLDTGDALAHHYHSKLDSGRTVFRNMAMAGYDALTPGSMDFIYGVENLDRLDRSDTSLTILSANLFRENGEQLFSPYRIFEKNGLKVGVIGFTESEIVDRVAIQQSRVLKAESIEDRMRSLTNNLRDSVDVLIALNHLTLDENLNLCRKIPGIDILISKSSEDSLRFLRVYDERRQANTTIVKSPEFSRSIGHLEVQVNGVQRRAVNVLPRSSIPVTSIGYDTIDLTDFDRMEKQFAAYTARKYNGNIPDIEVAEFSGIVSQELIDVALYSMLRATNSEIAFLNNGALVRYVLNQTGGNLTIRDIEGVTRPFDPVYTMRLTGKQVKAILQQSRQYDKTDNAFLNFLAINDYIDPTSDVIQPHGLPLVDDEFYAVTTNRFLAKGGDGYEEFTKGTHQRWEFEGTTLLNASQNPEAQSVFVNELLIQYFTTGRYPKNTEPLDFFREADFVNRPLWVMRFENVDFSYRSVRVNNNEDFEDANDKRVSSSTENATYLATSGYISGIRRTARTRWENGMLFRYGLQGIGDQEIQESDDKLELQTILDWNDPFGIYKDPKKLNLFSSLRIDTEFSRRTDDEGMKTPRRQDLYLYLGISRFGSQAREARIALFAKSDLSTGKIDAGIETNIKYFKSFKHFKHGSILRGRYLINRPDSKVGDEKASLDYTGYLEFKLFEFISIKPQINWFLFQDMFLKQVATNLQFSVNLSFSRLWKPQYIKFLRKDKV